MGKAKRLFNLGLIFRLGGVPLQSIHLLLFFVSSLLITQLLLVAWRPHFGPGRANADQAPGREDAQIRSQATQGLEETGQPSGRPDLP